MIDLLLDTHTFLWFVWDDSQLSPHAKSLIEDPANRKLISIATCWETTLKCSTGKLKLRDTSDIFLHREIASNNFDLLPIQLSHVTHTENLPLHHRDPFDRLLIAQAMIEKLTLVSRDESLHHYPITITW